MNPRQQVVDELLKTFDKRDHNKAAAGRCIEYLYMFENNIYDPTGNDLNAADVINWARKYIL